MKKILISLALLVMFAVPVTADDDGGDWFWYASCNCYKKIQLNVESGGDNGSESGMDDEGEGVGDYGDEGTGD